MRRHGPVIVHCTDSEDFPRHTFKCCGVEAYCFIIVIVDNNANINSWTVFGDCCTSACVSIY